MLAGNERRRYQRYQLNFPCSIRRPQVRSRLNDLEIQTETKDVSRCGVYVEVAENWELGSPIECLLQVPAKIFGGRPAMIRCRGKIARIEQLSEGRTGVGATIDHVAFLRTE